MLVNFSLSVREPCGEVGKGVAVTLLSSRSLPFRCRLEPCAELSSLVARMWRQFPAKGLLRVTLSVEGLSDKSGNAQSSLTSSSADLRHEMERDARIRHWI
jgi:hypothetical protein